MYSLVHTEGIVLKSYYQGEKDLFLSIFTKDLGHIFAKVSGVRDLNSKHRYCVQDYSLSNFALVKGKTGWKITNTSIIKSLYFENLDKTKRDIILRILTLVKRFYLGEEANPQTYDDLLIGFENILNAQNLNDIELEEAKTVANFLFDLGYVSQRINFEDKDLQSIRKIINFGIKNSGL
jgi:DNA repair protein RecO